MVRRLMLLGQPFEVVEAVVFALDLLFYRHHNRQHQRCERDEAKDG